MPKYRQLKLNKNKSTLSPKRKNNAYGYQISRAWCNGSYTIIMMTKPMKTSELHHSIIQFYIK